MRRTPGTSSDQQRLFSIHPYAAPAVTSSAAAIADRMMVKGRAPDEIQNRRVNGVTQQPVGTARDESASRRICRGMKAPEAECQARRNHQQDASAWIAIPTHLRASISRRRMSHVKPATMSAKAKPAWYSQAAWRGLIHVRSIAHARHQAACAGPRP